MDLGKDSITKLVIGCAIPSMLAAFVSVLYSIIDRMYIGHIAEIGPLALAGVGICGPIVTLITSFASWVGIGGAPLAAIAYGENKLDQSTKILSNAFYLLVGFSLVLTSVLFCIKEPLLQLFGATETTFVYANDYFTIILYGVPFALFASGLNSFISCQGHARIAMCSVCIGAIANIILDPVFIFTLGMDVKGAALATILSQFLSALFVVGILIFKKLAFNLRVKSVDSKIIKKTLTLGFSAFVILAFDNIMIIAMNKMLQVYGGSLANSYLTVNTIVQSIMLLITMPLGGISSGCQCILSYNFGACQMDRVKQGIKTVSIACVLFCTVMFVICIFANQLLIGLFTQDAYIVELTQKAIIKMILFVIPLGIQYALVDSLTALGQVKWALPLSFFRKGVYFIALFVLPLIFGIDAIFYAESISDFISPIISVIVVLRSIEFILQWHLDNQNC